ncbi:type II toxin-antitoxin system VapC family toxin [Leptospira kanakyensis]|uniref:Type II toxin-antitoxin system VapC family toxin n=1 Tax=Leptospira kanakyensis TaxID=2484968 RepID=A0A6N4PYI6_9LEPT|nr:PIN domain-containing protein [Leptospira kanakyensis]MCW7468784.1 type II toxin-antitoxin system VapC family toxin [Leptospira kanakyensis]MCW7479777.1 type II toxin-antitoxin system VapC family toxin [Leptospira kanakyensis]TGK50011.1 type II toxin-antitoxin system VapC family toxin [Leptospira kanakyensis]TGK58472.1 type II toxin-antitoxin system VapC family toxin [Leptospira kanakyensis]TGK69149.1 type II toxin-antitoxin system VapC family toxin [Leptospira kanakyensis]
MKLILDTNCYISFLNQRNLEQHTKMVQFWNEVSRLEHEVILTSHNISEIVFVFKSIYSIEQNKINQMIRDLIANPGVKYEAAYDPDLIFQFWPHNIKDYGDAVLAAACQNLDAKIVTFDQNFSKSLKKLNLEVHSI